MAGSLAGACKSESPQLSLVTPPPSKPSPDSVVEDKSFPASETAFGLPLLAGMRVIRHFADSAYAVGRVPLKDVVEHVRQHVLANVVEVTEHRTVFPRVYVKGDQEKRFFRIEVSEATLGTQIRISDVTPPPSPRGLNEKERWLRAGRNPDGTLLDPNSVF